MAAIGSIKEEASRAHRWGAAGIRSGLNQIKNAGWGGLFGMDHLRAIKGINSDLGSNVNKLVEGAGGLKAVRAMEGAARESIDSKLANLTGKAIEEGGSELWKFASGHGFSGLGRAGAIGARAGMGYAALQVADFLNPFGFGSISD